MPPVARRLIVALVAAVGLTIVASSAEAAAVPTPAVAPEASTWVWPLTPQPQVVRAFDPPDSPWLQGHRGVDLLGHLAQQVSAIGAGTVSFAGTVAGRGVVVVTHGQLRSTYEPVTASVAKGARVSAGAVIGLLQSVQSHCLPSVCLHLGLKRGDTYLDPLSLLGPRPVRLKPWTGGSPVPGVAGVGSPVLPVEPPGEEVAARSPGSGEGSAGRRLAVGLGLAAAVSGLWVRTAARRTQARG